ncbi:hypothetical protein Tco_0146136 [Tanacetum coccineum]
MNIIVNSLVHNAYVNVHECEKCLKLETELLNKKDFIEKETYDKLFRSYTTFEKHYIYLEVDTQLNQEIFQRDNSVSNQSAPNFDQYFELNELEAQSQEKDTVIRKLKERIKYLSGNINEDKVKKDIEEIETINIELEHKVSKLIAENEHLKQTYKQLYDSIKPTRIRSKEQCDALVNQVNQKSMEISNLNASLQEKDLVITALKNELRKLKGKDLADNIVTKNTNAPKMLKIDVEPIAPRLLKRLNVRLLQIQECIVQKVKASDAILGEKDCSRIVLDKGNDQGLENQSNTSGDESSRSRNECNDKSTFGDDTDIKPSYDIEPMVEVPYTAEYNVFAVDTQHSEQPECIINTCVVEKVDSNVIPDSPDMCDNEIQTDQNIVECDDERVALANLIANLKLDIDENKKIQKQLKKANASLTQELKVCKSTLTETSRTMGESNSVRDSCLIALQNKQTKLEKYMTFNNCTVDYDKLERKLNKTLRLLAQKEIDIKEGLKLKAYEISVVKEKHDELVKQSLLTKSHYEGLVKEKTKVIMDLKLKEEKDIDKMISMEK